MILSLVFALVTLGVTDFSNAAIIGSNFPTFGNDYFGVDNMAWNRPNKFVVQYPSYRKNIVEDIADDLDTSIPMRPSVGYSFFGKRRYRPSPLDDLKIKRRVYGLWKPAQRIQKVKKAIHMMKTSLMRLCVYEDTSL